MSSLSRRSAIGAVLLVAGAIAGLGVALYSFLMPLTGVTGTFGAGLVVFSTAIMLLAGFVVLLLPSSGLRSILSALIFLDIICTLAAGYFLHEWWLMVAMIVSFLGATWDVAHGRKDTQPNTIANTERAA